MSEMFNGCLSLEDMGDTELTKGTDYNLVYQNNVEVGSASAIVTGLGKYEGSNSASYVIEGISIENAIISLDHTVYSYDGSAKKPSVSVTEV